MQVIDSVEKQAVPYWFGVVERLGLGCLKPWHSKFATPFFLLEPEQLRGPFEPESASLGVAEQM